MTLTHTGVLGPLDCVFSGKQVRDGGIFGRFKAVRVLHPLHCQVAIIALSQGPYVVGSIRSDTVHSSHDHCIGPRPEGLHLTPTIPSC